MAIRIALAGNPNSGKTTMFNALTGSSQYVGNWPGVTVEKKEGHLKGNKDVIIQDLPGIYSLSPYSLEEVVTRNYLINDKPDVIINIVDSTNIERNIYLTTQLTELGVPVVIALNMIDIAKKNGDIINISKLSETLGCEVLETSALKDIGSYEAADKAIKLASKKANAIIHTFSDPVEIALAGISGIIKKAVPHDRIRWVAVKLFERDEKINKEINLSGEIRGRIEKIIALCESEMDDDSESIIINERYSYITKIIDGCVTKKNKTNVTVSDKIDRILTNRILALPIFAAVIFLIYFISISTVGGMLTGWVNDSLFGDGFFLLGNSSDGYNEAFEDYNLSKLKINAFLKAANEIGIDISGVEEALLSNTEFSEEEKTFVIGSFIIIADEHNIISFADIYNNQGGLEIIQVGLSEFLSALEIKSPVSSDYGIWIPGIPALVEDGLYAINAPEWMRSLIVDGIIAGVGAVLGFLPQILVLFLFLSILEDCGYMARIAFILDRIFRKFGLSGKSFIPIIIGTGCGVPGIMASRTIENERDRRITIITTTFIPCSAKLPVIALIAGALFKDSVWVAPSIYFIGMAAIVISGIVLKKLKSFSGKAAPFIMELPAYHIPGIKNVLTHTWDRGKSFVKKAGTVILLAQVVVWFLSSFNWTFKMVEAEESILASIGKVLVPVFIPLGWPDWKSVVAAITGLIAKENIVGTLGVLYGYSGASESGAGLHEILNLAFVPLSAYSFLIFNMLCAPCVAAIGAIHREMNSLKWTLVAVCYQTGFAYIVAFAIYQIGMLFKGNGFGIGSVSAMVLIVFSLFMIFRPTGRNDLSAIRMGANA